MSTILVVDDYPAIRLVLRTVLESCGHRVIEASDGHRAVRTCAQSPIDVLICDFLLPDMSASDVISSALKSNPQLKILVISGGSEAEIRQAGLSKCYRVITKPFRVSALARLIEQSLGSECPDDPEKNART